MDKKYSLNDLVEQCDLTQDTAPELKEWENMPDVGSEVIEDTVDKE